MYIYIYIYLYNNTHTYSTYSIIYSIIVSPTVSASESAPAARRCSPSTFLESSRAFVTAAPSPRSRPRRSIAAASAEA